MNTTPTGAIPLWQQLQSASGVLMAIQAGQSGTAAMDAVKGPLRPGVQSLVYHALRQWGRAQALRSLLALGRAVCHAGHHLVDESWRAIGRSGDARRSAAPDWLEPPLPGLLAGHRHPFHADSLARRDSDPVA